MPPAAVTLDHLNHVDQRDFVAALAEVFEHSPWVAEGACSRRPFASVDDLHGAMTAAMHGAARDRQLALIRAHPDLAGRAAIRGELTTASTTEQAGAGLDQCSAEEFARFQELNDNYKKKFDFPFIMAVKGQNRAAILQGFVQRLNNTPETEFQEALAQIAKIARFRLDALILA